MPRETITCPACETSFEADLEADVSLPPTGGDFDWCESTEGHDCPHCGANLGVSVRVWLGSFDTEVLGIEVRPPRPVASVPVHIRLNPAGEALVGYDGSRFRCWRAGGDGWHEPELLSDEAGGSTEAGCPALVFSSDGRLLLSNGQLFTAAQEPAGRVDVPGASLVGLGWLAGRPALAWRDLRSRPDPKYEGVTEHYWMVGVQRHRAAKEVEETQYEAHSGIVMSGRHLFDERRDRIIRLAPPRHGSREMTAEILRLEAGSLHLEAQTESLSLARVARLEGDALLLAVSWSAGSDRRRGIQVIDPATLEEIRRIPLPSDLFGDFDSIHDVCFLDEDHLLISTFTSLARVRIDGGVATTEHVFDLTHVRGLDARAGRAVAATDWELVELTGDDARPLPVPKHQTNVE